MRIRTLIVGLVLLLVTSGLAQTYTIGVSNGFIGSEWRTQMIRQIEAVTEELAEQGIEIELVIESANVDVQGQIQQVQNLLNRGVDAIIINPNDQSALNLALEEAIDEGVVVISVDQAISAQGVYNVVIDQTEWARISTRWLAEQLGGEGDIILIEGFVGHPANEDRMAGVEEVLAENPGINVIGRESGSWDQATAQQVTSDLLASLSGIDAIWTQDGMAQGVLTALLAAAPEPFPIMTGEAISGYLKLWNDTREVHPEFTSIGVVNPPGVGASGVRVAVEILQGGTVDASQLGGPFGNSLYVPIPLVVTQDNFDEVFAQYGDRSDTYVIDDVITQEQAAAFME